MKKRVVHFEIGCSDIPKSVDFYREVFQWDIQSKNDTAMIAPESTGAITGHINKLGSQDPQRYVTIYIETDAIEADLNQIEKHGGKVLVKPVSLPDGRTFAWFEDIAGNTLGLITKN